MLSCIFECRKYVVVSVLLLGGQDFILYTGHGPPKSQCIRFLRFHTFQSRVQEETLKCIINLLKYDNIILFSLNDCNN